MQAIQTRYLGPTNHRGSRIVAQCQSARIVLEWDDSMSVDQNHQSAARALILKMHWHRNHAPQGESRPHWYSGSLPGGAMVHVCAWPDAVVNGLVSEPARPYQSVR